MEWVNAEIKPKKVGKYVVQTTTSMYNLHKLEAHWNGKSWNVSNQIVIKWLKDE